MVGNITFLMIFAVFDPSPLTLDKLQFLVLIFSSDSQGNCNIGQLAICHRYDLFTSGLQYSCGMSVLKVTVGLQ